MTRPGADPERELEYDRLRVRVYRTAEQVGVAGAQLFASAVRAELAESETVSVILASATSQLSFLRALRRRDDIDWPRVDVLHMDEFVAIPADHPASFRRFLTEHLVSWARPRSFRQLAGDADDLAAEIERYAALVTDLAPAISVVGIGENGHLAFNDPPADFSTGAVVHRVVLDDACRRQQWGEGFFATLDAVPAEALSLTVPALIRPRHVVGIVPEARKAAAVRQALLGPVSADCPASVLRTVAGAVLHLDADSASSL